MKGVYVDVLLLFWRKSQYNWNIDNNLLNIAKKLNLDVQTGSGFDHFFKNWIRIKPIFLKLWFQIQAFPAFFLQSNLWQN